MPDHKTDHEEIWKEFGSAVNMTLAALEKWLQTDDSKSNGWKDSDGKETIGHHSGRRIVEIKHKKKADLTDDDYAICKRLSATFAGIWRKGDRSKTKSTQRGAIR